MAHIAIRTGVTVASTALIGLGATVAPQARADPVAYLVNVTVRPGYNFPNADAAPPPRGQR